MKIYWFHRLKAYIIKEMITICRIIRQNGGEEEYEVSNYWKYYAGGTGAV